MFHEGGDQIDYVSVHDLKLAREGVGCYCTCSVSGGGPILGFSKKTAEVEQYFRIHSAN